MAESKRVYEIRINGIQESYEGVKSLREALSGLTDTVINVSNEEKKTSETRKSTASSTDALAKAQEKLNNYDRAYQEELAKVNAELSANKKEINDALKLQQAQDVVDAKQLDTYAQKQQYLSALNTLIRNHSTATEEDTQAIDRMVQESAALQAELKATDAQMQIYVRNVGNYQGAADTMIESHKGIKQELKEIKTEMAEMLANGVSKTDEGYLKLAERAGQLKDALGDANQDIANFASDTQGLNNAINLASSAVNAYQLYNSTMELFGAGNEEAAESMKKMMAVMTVLNSLQQVQNSLLENGSATARLYNKAVELIQAALGLKKTAVEADTAATEANAAANEANVVSQEANAAANEASAVAEGVETAAKEANTVATGTNSGALGTNTTALGANAAANQTAATATNTMSVAQKAGAVASKTLSVALKAIPLMAIIGLVMTLIQNWESIWNWFKKTFPVLDTLSKKFNKFGGFMDTVIAIAKGLGKAIINWVVTPFKTLAQVIGKVLEGDFVGAAKVAIDNVKGMFTGFGDEIRKELKGAAEGAAEDAAKARMEKEHDATEYQLQELQARYGNEAKYSKEGIALQKKEFAQRKALAKGNAEELKKIHLEELSFQRECQEQQTKAVEKGAKTRAAAASKAAKDAQKAADEYKKMIEELQKANKKAIDEADKMIDDARKKGYKASGDAAKLQMDENLKQYRQQLETTIQSETAQKAFEDAYRKNLAMYEYYVKRIGELNEQGDTELAKGLEPLRDYLKNVLTTGDAVITEFKSLNETAQETSTQSLDNIKNLAMERKSAIINLFGEEARALKASYISTVDSLTAQIDKTKEELKTASGKTKAKLESDLTDLNSRWSFTLKAAKAELGDYYDEFMNLPVDVSIERITQWITTATKDFGKTLQFTAADVQNALLGVEGTISGILEKANKAGGIDEMVMNMRQLGKAANVSSDDLNAFEDNIRKTFESISQETDEYKKSLMMKDLYKTVEKDMTELFSKINSIQLSKFGTLAQGIKEQISQLDKEISENIIKAYQNVINSAEEDIAHFERNIKRFQEATKGVKFEPAMQDDFMSGLLKGQIIDLDKTRDRYDQLLDAYTKYRDSLAEGSEEMKNREAQWQVKLEASKRIMEETGKLHGTNSLEYKKAQSDYEKLIDEKEKEDAAYVIEYEKAQQKVDEITKKSSDLMYDYIESIANRFADITKTIQDNVMNPIFDGLSDLFAFQLEEAEDALEETEKLLDKAVEAREQSAERMKEINEELRADDGQNKEELQQRLAEEEVLLVQREEAERALEKEKKKREYEAQVADANQRKFELRQKLAEGIVNTALGVTAALKYGFPMGPIFAAIIGAMGALQTAIISKQIGNVKMPQKYAAGGKVGEDGVSRSHKQGGHRIEDTNIEVEGGEWVINKASSKKYDSLLKSINDDSVGLVKKQIEIIREKRIVERPNRIALMADGGQINTLAATRAVKENNEIAAISELIKQIDFQPTVSVVDINKVNKKLVRVQDYAGKAV